MLRGKMTSILDSRWLASRYFVLAAACICLGFYLSLVLQASSPFVTAVSVGLGGGWWKNKADGVYRPGAQGSRGRGHLESSGRGGYSGPAQAVPCEEAWADGRPVGEL